MLSRLWIWGRPRLGFLLTVMLPLRAFPVKIGVSYRIPRLRINVARSSGVSGSIPCSLAIVVERAEAFGELKFSPLHVAIVSLTRRRAARFLKLSRIYVRRRADSRNPLSALGPAFGNRLVTAARHWPEHLVRIVLLCYASRFVR
jgi:hypothetical protein